MKKTTEKYVENLTDDIYVKAYITEREMNRWWERPQHSYSGEVSIYDEMLNDILFKYDYSCDHHGFFYMKDDYIHILGKKISIPDEVKAIMRGDRSALIARLEKGFDYLKARREVNVDLLQKLFNRVNKAVESDLEKLKEGSKDRDNLAQRLQKIRATYQSKEVQDIISDEKERLKLQKKEASGLLNEDTNKEKKERNKRRQEVITEKKKMDGMKKRLIPYSIRFKKEKNPDRRDLLWTLEELREKFNSPEMKDSTPEESKRLKLRGVMHKKLKKEAGM